MLQAAIDLIIEIGKEEQSIGQPIPRLCPNRAVMDSLIRDGLVTARRTAAFQGVVYHDVDLTPCGWSLFDRLTRGDTPPEGERR